VSHRARVLIVDDERDIVNMLHDVLVDEGYDVRPVFTSSDALVVAAAFHPDVVLLDIAMPGVMGDHVLESLRAVGVLVPVIAISARPELAGPRFFDVIGKPARIHEVARVVAEAIRHGRAHDANNRV
jgi:DNA-binding response OmpR family regulator